MLWSALSETFIGQVVIFQTVMLHAGMVTTIVFLIARKYWRKYEAQKADQFTDKVINILFADPGAKTNTVLFWWDKDIYRDVLLSQIKVLTGHERETMVKHYLDMGFYSYDCVQVKSRYWWRRLRALIRIDILASTDSRAIFLRAIEDANSLVALEATRALSRLHQNVNPAMLFTSLERVSLKRQTALLEVISNIGQNYSVDAICDYLKICKNEDMAIACVQVLGTLQGYQVIPQLEEILKKPDEYSELYLVKILDAIALISDPNVIRAIHPLLSHASPRVRARSLYTLAILGDEALAGILENFKKSDANVEVQRIIQEIQKKAA
jgi:positive regulator of sigma E activity